MKLEPEREQQPPFQFDYCGPAEQQLPCYQMLSLLVLTVAKARGVHM